MNECSIKMNEVINEVETQLPSAKKVNEGEFMYP